jgi:hypothetical protein
VFDLVAVDMGEAAAVRLALEPMGSPRDAVRDAFHGRDPVHTEGAWRAHLARLAAV